MILHPGILSLLLSSILVGGMILYSAACGISILRGWDISSGSELQLVLERKTYLISTILGYLLFFQLISLFLFIYTVDDLCPLFTGAMCAVGTLTVNPFGYPVLICKTATFILAGLWLILNHADSNGYDYPLLRAKYRFLLVLAPLVVAEAVLQGLYFLNLEPDVITSCCGSLFSSGNAGVAAEIASLPALPMMGAFYSVMALTLIAGVWSYRSGKGGWLFPALSGIAFFVSTAAVISFVSLYFYELPTHHCPFCILQKEYHYVGYPLYIFLLAGTVTGLGTGVLKPFRSIASLSGTLPALRKRLTLTSVLCYLLFIAIASWPILFSSFTLDT
ncbi:MAG: hypothetical protein EG824_04870 [Deltaproteobacteria bacterium]|nr:hypothetical protein [Deltaproteobacteria bacterium]